MAADIVRQTYDEDFSREWTANVVKDNLEFPGWIINCESGDQRYLVELDDGLQRTTVFTKVFSGAITVTKGKPQKRKGSGVKRPTTEEYISGLKHAAHASQAGREADRQRTLKRQAELRAKKKDV